MPLNTYAPDTDEPTLHSRYLSYNTIEPSALKKELTIIGLGKMGGNLARQLIQKGWHVVGYNRTPEVTKGLEKEGLDGLYSLTHFRKTAAPRIVWLMLPAGKPMDEMVWGENGLIHTLQPGDIIIDGSNSFYEDTVKRAALVKKQDIEYLDVGVSGGPGGALSGASCMVGGDEETFKKIKPLLEAISVAHGVAYVGKSGAGHFVKMVHNGIEYGMMQSIAEGFNLLEKSKFKFNLTQIADVYNHGTVIESRLLHWLKKAYEEYGEKLETIPGTVSQTGEGQWTLETGEKMKVNTPALKAAVDFRTQSSKNPSYTGKTLSALRRQFGGHKT
jgi:6-phosphogluconate dehydrogenase